MDTLGETTWDVVISGTGLPQSLLALALSKSDKKVLHVDKNNYYGGTEAALSLDDAARWTEQVKNDPTSGFESPVLTNRSSNSRPGEDQTPRLDTSRSYSLSLSPQIIYARSKLLSTLVASGTHQQLEFQAVGSWWLCKDTVRNAEPESAGNEESSNIDMAKSKNTIHRIPSSREDVFADATLDTKSKRTLMKFLRSMVKDDSLDPDISTTPDASISEAFGGIMKIPSVLHDPLLALSLLPLSAQNSPAGKAISRIRRHLVSLGVFGAGFAAVVPKWGGISEIAQVGCRAGAVGGGTYVLGRGITGIEEPGDNEQAQDTLQEHAKGLLQIELSNGEKIKTKWVAASPGNVPQELFPGESSQLEKSARSINIVSLDLEQLFPSTSENGPMPACAIVMLPATSGHGKFGNGRGPPVYLSIHSSDTGECPAGQCVIYASTAVSDPDPTSAYAVLDVAVERLLAALSNTKEPQATVLWQLHYAQSSLPPSSLSSFPLGPTSDARFSPKTINPLSSNRGGVLMLPPPSLDLAFDDSVVDAVKEVWARIVGVDLDGPDAEGFMVFEGGRREEGDVDQEEEG